MSTAIKPGDTVRVLPSYGDLWTDTDWDKIGKNTVGTEFVVEKLRMARSDESVDTFYVTGDPAQRGIWGKYIERVLPEPKMHTTTTMMTRHEWIDEDRIVLVTSGRGGVNLTVQPNPYRMGDTKGTTGLTPEQAEELANDILERVAEIRAGLKEEAGE